MLQINHLTITHQKDLQELIRDLNLVVNSGDKLAIIGEEGTGKSTLIKAIANPQLLADYVSLDGSIINRFQQVAYLPQQLPEKELAQKVTAFLYDDIDYNRFDFNRFYQLAEQFQLDLEEFERKQQSLVCLSGGEKIKLQLLKLLAYEPDLLLLDEPSSDLDIQTVTWLENFLQKSKQTIIFISHDETLLTKVATDILHLELLKKRTAPRATYFHGHYEAYRTQRKHLFERQLQRANKEREEHEKKVAKHLQVQQSVQNALRKTKDSTAGRLLVKKMHSLQSQERRFNKEATRLTEVPQDMDSLQLFFSDIAPLPANKKILAWEKRLLETGQAIDLQIRGQDKLVITGANGIGKTRLVRKIMADLVKRSDLSLGYMPQQYEEFLDPKQSALAFLTESVDQQTARTILASLQFTREEILHSTQNLSGGQKAKLFLAKMVLEKNNVLILDEPTRHFSPMSQPLIRQLLQHYPGCIISISHDRLFIQDVANTHYQLTQKQLLREE